MPMTKKMTKKYTKILQPKRDSYIVIGKSVYRLGGGLFVMKAAPKKKD